jgi:hypothetical protein
MKLWEVKAEIPAGTAWLANDETNIKPQRRERVSHWIGNNRKENYVKP